MSRRERVKIMKLRRRLLKWLSRDEDDRVYTVIHNDTISSPNSPNRPSKDGLNFVLYPAVGGHILECRNYDRRTDTNNNTLYMIHDDEDFARQVAQAIMLEQMKL
jgi:hypothetical protein